MRTRACAHIIDLLQEAVRRHASAQQPRDASKFAQIPDTHHCFLEKFDKESCGRFARELARDRVEGPYYGSHGEHAPQVRRPLTHVRHDAEVRQGVEPLRRKGCGQLWVLGYMRTLCLLCNMPHACLRDTYM
jgi:hypothetical protein